MSIIKPGPASVVDESAGERISIHKRWISLLCAVCAAAIAVGAGTASREASSSPGARAATAAAPAYKEKSFSNPDVIGDAQKDSNGNPAADISDVTIFNTKTGVMYVLVTIDQTKLYNGDEIDVFIDTDRNTSTGCSGDEYVLSAVGITDPNPDKFELGKCSAGKFNFQASQAGFNGAFELTKRRIDFRFTTTSVGGAGKFNYVVGTFWSPNTTDTFKDFAPNTGHYSFTLERQKVSCSSVFGRLVRDPGWAGVTSGGFLVLRSLRMRGVPSGATVQFQSGAVAETVRADSSGVARSRRLLNRKLPKGSAITVRIKKDTCSTTVNLRVNSEGRLVRSG